MEAALAPLWRIPSCQSRGVFQHVAFKWLERHCEVAYPSFGNWFSRSFALMHALNAVGLPCEQPPGLPAVNVATAARRFVDAMQASTVTRRYLAPLHLADDLPSMHFGNARVTRFTPDELREVMEFDQLVRQGHALAPDIGLLSQLQWLVVEHTVPTLQGLAARGSRLFQGGFEADSGAIDPHEGRHPAPVMDALFALLLQPWEEWHGHGDYDWRAFTIPWVHVATGDIFDRAQAIPPAADLAWESHYVGDEEVGEKPIVWNLELADTAALEAISDAYWARLEKARHSVLLETPVQHFLLRAFFSDGMDEIIAHMTAVEAALGLQADFTKRGRRRLPAMNPSERVQRRIEALLDDSSAGLDYKTLSEVRGEFVHGRKIEGKVPSETRNLARRLARRVANALVEKAQDIPDWKPREGFLSDLC
jgi:hypothetical protein